MIGLNSGLVVVELAAVATQGVRTRRDGSLLRAIESIVPINRDCRIQMGLEIPLISADGLDREQEAQTILSMFVFTHPYKPVQQRTES